MPITYFERFAIELPLDVALECSQPGRAADAFVEAALRRADVRAAIYAPSADAVRDELREYGAWGPADLEQDAANRGRLLWIASCDIREGREQESDDESL